MIYYLKIIKDSFEHIHIVRYFPRPDDYFVFVPTSIVLRKNRGSQHMGRQRGEFRQFLHRRGRIID
jgi:hypothetical protein